MSDLESHIKLINGKLGQLLKNHLALKKENESLKEDLKRSKQKEEDYKSALRALDEKVGILKVASGQMIEKDQKEFERRINLYIKDIDKCIGLLSE